MRGGFPRRQPFIIQLAPGRSVGEPWRTKTTVRCGAKGERRWARRKSSKEEHARPRWSLRWEDIMEDLPPVGP